MKDVLLSNNWKKIILLLLVAGSAWGHAYAQFPAPYCSVTFVSGAYPITLVSFAGISNASSPSVGGAVQSENYTSISTNVVPGSTYPIVVKGNTDGNWSYYVTVYFDWNRDNDFLDANELQNVGIITNSTGVDAIQASTNITVPPNAVAGTTRMRVTYLWNSYTSTACNTSGYGQAEDYTLIVKRFSYNNAGVASLTDPVNICGGNHDVKVRVKNNGNNVIGNVTINWTLDGQAQTPVFWNSPIDTAGSVNGNDTVITLGSNIPFTPYVSRSLRAWTSLPNGVADTVNADDTLTTTITSNCPTYCAITFPSGAYPITRVKIGSINNTSSATPLGTAYENFTSLSTNVTLGHSYPIVVQGNTDGNWSYYVTVFVDWNHDYDFLDFGESQNIGVITNSTGTDAIQVQGNITVPPNATPGYTTMRVAYLWNSYISSSCNNSGYGQAEDYQLHIVPNVPNNAGVTKLVSPVSFCAGSQDVKVRIANMGSNAIANVTVEWQLDGVTQSPVYWPFQIDTAGSTNGSDTVITLGNVFFTGPQRMVKAWTSFPNGTSDTVNFDDTLTVAVKPSLGGTYSIGAGGDYASLSAAVSDLNNFGVCGPVVFNVKSGNYTAHAEIGNIAGASDVNTITFRSAAGNPDSVSFSYNAAASTDNYVLRLNGSRYVKLKDLSFTAQNSSYGRVIELTGGASSDTIERCKLTSQLVSTTSVDMAPIYASAFTGRQVVIRNSTLVNGSYGIYYSGSSTTSLADSCIFEGNSIQNPYAMGAYFYYTNNLKCRNNTISLPPVVSNGIYCYYAYNGIEISGNRISGQSGNYGMQLRYINSTATARAIVCNNSIAVGAGATTSYGIWCRDGAYMSFLHNSVNISSTGTSSYAGYFYFSTSSYSNNEIRNNIFANSGGGYALYNYTPAYAASDNNLLYTTGTNLAQNLSTSYLNLAAWRTGSGQDINSVSYRPAFTSSTNLQPNAGDTAVWALNGRAVHLAGNFADINGNARALTPADGVPDLGAYEVTPASLPPLASASPSAPAAGSTQVFLCFGDTVAKITWDAFTAAPATVVVRLFSGEKHPATGSPVFQSYFYTRITMPGNANNYNASFYYKRPWKGNIVNENDMRITTRGSFNLWNVNPFGTIDTAKGIMTGQFFNEGGDFTGTDQFSPLPVTWITFQAENRSGNVLLTWMTASELNSKGFEVERSTDGRTFDNIGFVKGSGNSSTPQSYAFTDPSAFETAGASRLYYRLKQVDRDAGYSYSEVVSIAQGSIISPASLQPNPCSDQVTLQLYSAAAVQGHVAIIDLAGRTVLSRAIMLQGGMNAIAIDGIGSLNNGLYTVKVTAGNESSNMKLIKTD